MKNSFADKTAKRPIPLTLHGHYHILNFFQTRLKHNQVKNLSAVPNAIIGFDRNTNIMSGSQAKIFAKAQIKSSAHRLSSKFHESKKQIHHDLKASIDFSHQYNPDNIYPKKDIIAVFSGDKPHALNKDDLLRGIRQDKTMTKWRPDVVSHNMQADKHSRQVNFKPLDLQPNPTPKQNLANMKKLKISAKDMKHLIQVSVHHPLNKELLKPKYAKFNKLLGFEPGRQIKEKTLTNFDGRTGHAIKSNQLYDVRETGNMQPVNAHVANRRVHNTLNSAKGEYEIRHGMKASHKFRINPNRITNTNRPTTKSVQPIHRNIDHTRNPHAHQTPDDFAR